jgi:phospholipid transport system transporter-binding protein
LQASSSGRIEVRGALTFSTARHAREEGLRAITDTQSRQLEADCAGISAADSAGLTVLLDWLAHAKVEGKSLRFTNLPAEILAVARISDVEDLLKKGV